MIKHLLTGTLLLTGFLFPTISSAQALHCGSTGRLQQLYAERPDLQAAQQQLLLSNVQPVTENGHTRAVYYIPVVFHILYENSFDNISDAQVLDAMRVLNEDFRMLNTDLSQVVPEFTDVAADCQIEFRLAGLDPEGNCTNGIERMYTHEANAADDWSKFNQWPPEKYLNIWVVSNIATPGTAGYSYPPAVVADENLSHFDGVMVINDYVGSIGTSNPYSNRSITHEVGHWLGLQHTWGNVNPPNVACGDDGISDTPVTKGHDNCIEALLHDETCNPGTVENTQNFMEFSFCTRMFTEGQAAFMRNALEDTVAGRNNLITSANHVLTGIDIIPAPLCIPEAAFSSNYRMICAGGTVNFTDASRKAPVATYLWSFPGGIPSSSTAQNPSVVYNEDGHYNVTLTVTNAEGSGTQTIENMIYVSGDWHEIHGPAVEDFEGSTAGFWLVDNPENNFGQFTLLNGAGKDLSKGYALKVFRDVSQAVPYSEEWYYDSRLGGSKDYLTSPSFDLSNTAGISISYDYSYATRATEASAQVEKLKVYSSRDCGRTWTLRQTLEGESLLTVSTTDDTDFVPANNSEWKTASFTYNASPTDTRTRFRFEFTASDYSNNLFIDNINISGTLGITDGTQPVALELSPNPVAAGNSITLSVELQEEPTLLQLTDVNGAIVSTFEAPGGTGLQLIEIPMNAVKGCYFLRVSQGSSQRTERIIVF